MRLRRFAHSASAPALVLSIVVLQAVATGSAPVVDTRLSANDDAYMNRQAAALLTEAGAALDRVPPRLPEPRERRLALRIIDAVLHDPHAPARLPVQAFYHARIERAVRQIERTRVGRGARIWKLYDHGFIVRTPTVTFAFDLYRGPAGSRAEQPDGSRGIVEAPGFPIADALARRLVRQCDALFISHRHGDHADPVVAGAFLDAGKPVVAPGDVFEGQDIQRGITRLERSGDRVQTLPVQQDRRRLRVVVYPGQQYQGSGVPNNVVLVTTPEGLTFAHNGDQINDPYPAYQKDFAWIDRVKDRYQVDVLITNCWTNDPLRIARGFSPALILSGHENELGHPTWDRVPFWGDERYLQLNYTAMKRAFPTVVMAWGESYRYVPGKRRHSETPTRSTLR